MVKTNRLKKIALRIGGMTKLPSWPMITATTRVQAVVPIEKPKTLKRPRMVPIAIDSSRKISGAVAMTHVMVSMPAIPRETAAAVDQQPDCQKRGSPLIQIKPASVPDVVKLRGRQWHAQGFDRIE